LRFHLVPLPPGGGFRKPSPTDYGLWGEPEDVCKTYPIFVKEIASSHIFAMFSLWSEYRRNGSAATKQAILCQKNHYLKIFALMIATRQLSEWRLHEAKFDRRGR
jgi:hypothetical protein